MAEHHFEDVRVYSPKIANPEGTPDSVYLKTGDFSFRDQDGAFGSADLEGRVWALHLIYPGCRDTCPKMYTYMRAFQDKYGELPDKVNAISLSVSPVPDDSLRIWAARESAKKGFWHFVSGDSLEVRNFVLNKMFPLGEQESEMQNFHIFRLVDKEGVLRGWDYTRGGQHNFDTLKVDVHRMLLNYAEEERNEKHNQ